MQVTVDEEGETRVRDRFVVSAPVMGRVQRIELEPGDPVVRGKTVVARLTPAAAPLIDPRTQAELTAGRRGRAGGRRSGAAPSSSAPAPDATRARSTVQRLGAAAEVRRDLRRRARGGADDAAERRGSRAGCRVRRSRAQSTNCSSRVRGSSRRAPAAALVTVIAPVDGVVLKRLRESATVVPAANRCSRSAIRAASRSSPICCRRTPCACRRGERRPHRSMGRHRSRCGAASGAWSRPAS